MNNRRKKSLYYGWTIVAVAALSMGVWLGMRTTFSLFLVALLKEFPWSRAEVAGVQSVSFLVYTVTAPIVGALIDRLGPKPVILPGILTLCLGLILSARMENLFQFYVFYGVIASCGITTISITAYSAILSHWFEMKRGLANGVAVAGMGVVILFLSPLTQYVINVAGWRLAFVLLAGAVFVLLFPLSALLLRHKPQERGAEQEGAPDHLPGRRGLAVVDPVWANRDWTLARAARERRFWYFLAYTFLAILPVYIVLIHLAKMLDDLGYDPMYVAFMIVSVTIVSSLFKIIWGWLSDYLGREVAATAGLVCLVFGMVVLLFLGKGASQGLLYLFIFFFGCGWAVLAPTNMSVSADLFQGRSFGLIFGTFEAVCGLGQALGPWLAGSIFDHTGSYQAAILVGLAAGLASIPFVWACAPRKVRGKGGGV